MIKFKLNPLWCCIVGGPGGTPGEGPGGQGGGSGVGGSDGNGIGGSDGGIGAMGPDFAGAFGNDNDANQAAMDAVTVAMSQSDSQAAENASQGQDPGFLGLVSQNFKTYAKDTPKALTLALSFIGMPVSMGMALAAIGNAVTTSLGGTPGTSPSPGDQGGPGDEYYWLDLIKKGQESSGQLAQLYDPKDFNAYNYLNANPDLLEAGLKPSAWAHWNNYGQKEGREIPFNAANYLIANPDLVEAGVTIDNAYEHFQNSGQAEGRQGWFDEEAYLEANPDLKDRGIKTGTEIYDHWVNYGKEEGRPLAPSPRSSKPAGPSQGYVGPPASSGGTGISDNDVLNPNLDLYSQLDSAALGVLNQPRLTATVKGQPMSVMPRSNQDELNMYTGHLLSKEKLDDLESQFQQMLPIEKAKVQAAGAAGAAGAEASKYSSQLSYNYNMARLNELKRQFDQELDYNVDKSRPSTIDKFGQIMGAASDGVNLISALGSLF